MKPNILFITTDQQRYDTVNAAGHSHVWTPNLDWLCDSGIRYTNAFSDCPVCMPARTTIMTGKYGYEHGVMSNKWKEGACTPENSLPGLLTAAGYQTRLHGKAHFGPDRVHQGFEHMVLTEDHHRMLRLHPEVQNAQPHGIGNNVNAPAIDPKPARLREDAWLVDQSLDFIETRDESRPFFLWLSFFHPHPPYTPGLESWSLYQNKHMPPRVVGDWSSNIEEIPPAWQAVTRELSMTQRYDEAQLEEIRRAYHATITQVDAQLGRLFGGLQEAHLLENTWIIFTSDHGEMLGDHYLGGKCVPLDASSRIPLIIRPPHSARDTRHAWRGSCEDAWSSLADILPTCCAIAECDPAEALQGQDLTKSCAQQLEGHDVFYHSCMYLHAVRKGEWKLCRETLDGSELLFHLKEDPLEQHNRREDPAAHSILQELQALLDQHLDTHHLSSDATQDAGVLTSSDHLPENSHPGHLSGRI